MFTAQSAHDIGKPVKIGKPLQFTSTKHLLFRVDNPEQGHKILGCPVVDTSMTNRIGTVFDLFGPVDKPFLSVKVAPHVVDRAATVMASNCFVLVGHPRSKRRTKVLPRKPNKRT